MTHLPHHAETRTAPAVPGLQSRVVAALAGADQARLVERATAVAAALRTWASPFPCIRQVRAWPLALSVAVAAPFADVAELLDTARLSLWVFTLDDLFDDGGLGHLALQRRAARYQALVRGWRSRRWQGDPLAESLVEVRAGLRGYPLFAPLQDLWEHALCRTIDTMLVEDRWRRAWARRGAAALPSFAEYLAVGRWSIGGPPHIWAAVITTGDPSTPAHLPRLLELERLASCGIRLANDLRSREKERAEGTVNSLLLLTPTGDRDAAGQRRSAALVEAEIARLQAEFDALLESAAGTATGRPEAAIAGILAMVTDYYRSHDYHQLVPPMPAAGALATAGGNR